MADNPRRTPQPPRLHARGEHATPRTVRPGRRSRWDASATVTERDVIALRWVGEQYAARSDVLRVLLGRLSPGQPRDAGILAEETLRQIVERWSQRGLVTRHRLLGWLWVVPTRRALHLVGLTVPAWSPVAPQLAHVHAVGIVRLAVEPTIPTGGRWVCERELRRETAAANVPDGAVELPEQAVADSPPAERYGEPVDRLAARVAIEVELTRKSAGRLREILTRPRHSRYLRTVYYAADDVAGYLARQVTRIGPAHRVDVYPLPPVDGTTYGGAL